MVKVYTKKRGAQPDLSDPICLRAGATIETVCHGIHRGLAAHFKWVFFYVYVDQRAGRSGIRAGADVLVLVEWNELDASPLREASGSTTKPGQRHWLGGAGVCKGSGEITSGMKGRDGHGPAVPSRLGRRSAWSVHVKIS